MSERVLNLEVHWPAPNARKVLVKVYVMVPLGQQLRFRRMRRRPDVHAIGSSQIDGAGTFTSYLAELTASESDGAVVEAACFEPLVSSLLSALHVEPPIPDPIPVLLLTP